MPGPQSADGAAAPLAPATPGATRAPAPGPPRRLLPMAVALQTLISAGDGLGMVGMASRVYQGSHASWAVAAVFLATTVPITVLAPVAGLVLDRLPARPALVAAAAAQAVLAAAVTRATSTGALLGLAAGLGLCLAVLQPGLGVIVPQLAGPGGVTRANGYLQAATWTGFTLGPLLAGVLIAADGSGAALAGVAVMYALGAVLLRFLPLTRAAAQSGSREPFLRQIGAGLRFLRADPEASLLVSVVGIMVTFANMAMVVEIVFAERVLRSGPAGYAILVSGWTAGMLGGTLLGGRVPRHRLATVTLLGTIATGCGVALAGAAATLWQAVAAYGFGGFANGMETVATRSFLNHRAPEAVAGRVFALYSGVLFGATSLGMAAAGSVLTPLGPRLVLLIAGSGGVLAGAAGLLLHRRRAAGTAQTAAQSIATVVD